MTKLKLSSVKDEKPVKLFVSLPAALHRDIVAYAEILARESGQAVEPAKLIPPMLASFIASDREFAKARNGKQKSTAKPNALPEVGASPTSHAPD
jgi:hypothetical protein